MSAPPNDDFANAIVITGSSGIIFGNSANATLQPGEPQCTGDDPASIWYSWVAPSNNPVRFDTTGSDFVTTIGIYTGTAVNSLTNITCGGCGIDSDANCANFVPVAGITYSIRIAGFPESTGNVVLNWCSAICSDITIISDIPVIVDYPSQPCGIISSDCTTPSGSVFPLGTTAVTCQLQMCSTICSGPIPCSFNVIINSPTPPPPPIPPLPLIVTKTASQTSATTGDTVVFSIIVTNPANNITTAGPILIIDNLPNGLTFTSCNPPTCSNVGQVITFTLTSLIPGASQLFQITTLVNGTARNGIPLINSVRVTDPATLTNITAIAQVLVVPPTLVLTKIGPSIAFVGESITYTIMVKNTGLVVARNIYLTDTICISSSCHHKKSSRNSIHFIQTTMGVPFAIGSNNIGSSSNKNNCEEYQFSVYIPLLSAENFVTFELILCINKNNKNATRNITNTASIQSSSVQFSSTSITLARVHTRIKNLRFL